MNKTLFAFLCLLVASDVAAFNPIMAEPPRPYEIIAIEGDPYVQREYLGNLADFPDMYEVSSDVAFTLNVKLQQLAGKDPVPFALIIIRQNDADGGVTEVARFNQEVTTWKTVSHSALGLNLLESDLLQKEVAPGTYRIEVSTPENKGDYLLVIGDEPVSSGYFKTLGDIRETQDHFGYTIFHMFFSSYVYYPLGIILVLFGIFKTWQFRQKITHAR